MEVDIPSTFLAKIPPRFRVLHSKSFTIFMFCSEPSDLRLEEYLALEDPSGGLSVPRRWCVVGLIDEGGVVELTMTDRCCLSSPRQSTPRFPFCCRSAGTAISICSTINKGFPTFGRILLSAEFCYRWTKTRDP